MQIQIPDEVPDASFTDARPLIGDALEPATADVVAGDCAPLVSDAGDSMDIPEASFWMTEE
jgi:hypothetical protein